jgi:hypothetical protein
MYEGGHQQNATEETGMFKGWFFQCSPEKGTVCCVLSDMQIRNYF